MVLLKFDQTFTNELSVASIIAVALFRHLLECLLCLGHHFKMLLRKLFAIVYLKHEALLDVGQDLLSIRRVRFFNSVSEHIYVLRRQLVKHF